MATQSQLQRVLVRVPWKGIDSSSAPMEMAQETGRVVQNLIPGRPGRLCMRGAITSYTPVTVPDGLINNTVPGLWIFDDSLQFRSSNNAAEHVLAYSPPDYVMNAGYAPNTNFVKFLYERFGNYTFGNQTRVPADNGAESMWRWDGGAGAANFVRITQGGYNHADYANFSNRLMMLGGTTPGSGIPTLGPTEGEDGAIWWSDPLWNGTDTLASFQDDVTGLVNKIQFDSGAQGQRASLRWHTLIQWYRSLYILGTPGIYEIRGSGPSNWTVRQVSSVGCRVPVRGLRPAAAADDGIYYHGVNGIVRFDGVKTSLVSGAVQELLPNLPNAAAQIINVGPEHLMVLFDATKWFLYNRLTGHWVELLSSAYVTGRPRWIRKTQLSGIVVAIDQDANTANPSGISIVSDISQPDNLRTLASPVLPGTDQGNPDVVMTGTITSRPIDLSGLHNKAQLNRIYADVVLTQSSGAGTPASVTLEILDETGAVIASGSATGNTSDTRKQIRIDCKNEVNSIQLRWTYNTQNQAMKELSIHDALVEYQTTRSRDD